MLLSRIVISVTCLLAIIILMAQRGHSSPSQILHEYVQADSVYQSALKISSNQNSEEAEEEKVNQKALSLFNEVYKNIKELGTPSDSILFHVTAKMGELQQYFFNNEKALSYYKEALSLSKKLVLPDSLLFRPYLFSGIIYYAQNNYDSTLFSFKQAEKIELRYNHPLHESQRLYNSLGALYFATGNYSSAKIYFQKAQEVLSIKDPYFRELYVNYNINLASSLIMLEEYDAANAIYTKLLPLGINLDEINHSLGVIMLRQKKGAKALEYFRKVVYHSSRIVRLYNDMGSAYFQMNQLDAARYCYKQALTTNEQYNKNLPNTDHGNTFAQLANLLIVDNKVDSALQMYQFAIHQFYPSYKERDVTNNPAKFSGVFSYISLFNTLVDKAKAFSIKYHSVNDTIGLKLELGTYLSAFSLVDYVTQTYNSDEARLFLNKIKYIAHSRPIDIALRLYAITSNRYYLEKAYWLDQSNKASILTYNLQWNDRNKSLPALQEERRIKTEITALSLKALGAKDEQQLTQFNEAIRSREIELGKWQEKINESEPGVVVNIPSITELQEQLDDHSELLSYHLTDSTVTIFDFTKKSAVVKQFSLPQDFHNNMVAFIRKLHEQNLTAKDSLQASLYRLLIGSKKKDRVIIIPDDELNYLPFELLVDENGKYLIENSSIQYHFSTALLKPEKQQLNNIPVTGFAPYNERSFQTKDFALERLAKSSDEIMNDQKRFFNDNATKSAFLSSLGNEGILHLATHASVNDSNDRLSFIAFYPTDNINSDYLLYSDEINNLQMKNIRLVMLSACETGYGNLVKGEGVMSLSRSFAFAGCPDIITSLWKANDFATSRISKQVMAYIKKGYSIDIALQKAKLDYLQDETINPRLKSPVYWAHLVFIGNYQQDSDHRFMVIILVIMLMLSGGWFLYKRKAPGSGPA